MRTILVGIAILVVALRPAHAHEGPPYPIVVDRAVGPYMLSVWGDPDVGTGTFFVIFDPPPSDDPTVSIEVWPSTQRLAPVRYASELERDHTYRAEAQFDREEPWQVKLLVDGGSGATSTEFEVLVTPPGYGKWDLLIYFTPFLLLGGMWALVWFQKRKLAARR